MKYAAPKGVFDILPAIDLKNSDEPWRASELWQQVESTVRQLTRDYCYSEIRTPMFERTELFTRSVGEDSDIVNKEMYTFDDKGGRSMTLRPEGTASVMRAFVGEQLANCSPIHKYFYIAPMFRYERPQSGRYRQHHQFGVEAIGHDAAEQDVEVIELLYTFYKRLGLRDLNVYVNSLGNPENRTAFRSALINYLTPFREKLSEDSQSRLVSNPLRILDSKDEGDRVIVAGAPTLLEFLDPVSRDRFESVQRGLTLLGVPFVVNHNLVRGLDYYTQTVFEVTAGQLGAQNSIGGGGRYDGLIKTLGGGDLPSIGFGTGLERVIQTMLRQEAVKLEVHGPRVMFIPLGDEAISPCMRLVQQLRERHISSEMDFSGKKLKKSMGYADTIGAEFVAVVGENEIKNDRVQLKHMKSGKTIEISFSAMLGELEQKISEITKG
jgi:histidyl-tRNA synthetase